MVNKEYDSFGPWVYEIKDILDIPNLFKPYCEEVKTALLALKIPRNIERRNANPSMDLYDYILCIYEGYLLILKRETKNVNVIKIKFKDIVSIKNSRDLLLGTITFYLYKEVISFNYSTVSSNVIQRFLKQIRDRYTENTKFVIEEFLDTNFIKGIDYFYTGLLRDFEKPEDQFKVLAIQGTIKARPLYANKIEKFVDIFNIFRENQLQNIMYLTNEKELLVVTRGKAFKREKVALYSYEFTYIPISKITDLRYDSISEYDNISPFFIEAGEHTFKYYFENINNQWQNLSKILG